MREIADTCAADLGRMTARRGHAEYKSSISRREITYMHAGETDGDLLALTHRLLEALRTPALAPFLADWPTARDSRRSASSVGVRAGAPAALPVLRWLPRIGAGAHPFASALVSALCRAAPRLAWKQSYTADDLGTTFMHNYGWTEILGPRGGETRGNIACGLLLLGPHTYYPPHRHEAEEIYVPLSGTAEWQQGDAIWRAYAPGTLIHHRSEEPHAMRTGEEPLLALYLWRSAHVLQQARLDRRGVA